MKSFTATHLNKHAKEVFAAAKDGPVFIEHDRYQGGFVINHVDTTNDIEHAHALAIIYEQAIEHHYKMEAKT